MARDASSQNDRGAPSASESDSRQTHDQASQPAASNLTELAQLLAASIAQNQAGRVPTNADLTSLANLVSAASGQRTLAPVFKDGLSSLSYLQPPSQPRSTSEHSAMPSLELGHDEEPMPIPSTWRRPAAHDEDRWLRQQMGAAVLGLIAGLMIVVPTVLWLIGWFEPPKAKSASISRVAAASQSVKVAADAPTAGTAQVQVRPAEKPPEAVQQYITSSIEPRSAIQVAAPPAPAATVARLVEPKAQVEELLARAAQRIESGDVASAREILIDAGDDAQGSVVFALAETYDPNMLAAWGSRGIASDVAKARALYRKAFGLGIARAQVRLEGLK